MTNRGAIICGAALLCVGNRVANIPPAVTFGLANTYPLLLQSVYDDFADDEVSVINMPAGDWQLVDPLLLSRSDVTVNFAGCRLHARPTNELFAPISVASTSVVEPKYLPSPTGEGPGVRIISHATGVIAAATTTLTMDPAEVVAVTPGETVLIWAGVTPSDAVEVQAFIPATVLSVNVGTGVITFDAPLGKDIINYGSLEGLEAATHPDLQWKIGVWGTYPDQGNFSKGYGIDHGIERFVGGLVHDVTLNDPSLYLDPLTNFEDMPNGMMQITGTSVRNLTINNAKVHNPFSVGMHLWRAFDVVVNGYNLSGVGSSRTWNVVINEAVAIAIWGGEGYEFNDLHVRGTDITIANVEVEAEGITFNGIDFDVTFTALRTFENPPVIFGFFSVTGVPVITDASIKATHTGGSQHAYFAYAPVILNGAFVFPGSSLTQSFSWNYNFNIALEGTVAIGGVTYGPAVTDTLDYTIVHGAAVRTVTLPPGLYVSATLQLLSNGDLYSVTDSFGEAYWSAAEGGSVTNLEPSRWHAIPSGGAALTAYVNKHINFWQLNEGSTSDATVRFQVTYLPANP